MRSAILVWQLKARIGCLDVHTYPPPAILARACKSTCTLPQLLLLLLLFPQEECA